MLICHIRINEGLGDRKDAILIEVSCQSGSVHLDREELANIPPKQRL